MKTSFYFVLWILIYPILGLLDSSMIDNNAFFVALIAVWGISWLLGRLMPETLAYERVSQVAPILEDVYTGNVTSFNKRLSQNAIIETVTSAYFVISTVVIVYAVLYAGVDNWIASGVFIVLTFSTISRANKLLNANYKLKDNPNPEQCAEIAEETYKLDYSSYYEERQNHSYEEMLPPRPKHFKAFQIFSIVMAIVATILGIIYLGLGIGVMLAGHGAAAKALAGMYFLYGSLATYFGIKDIITIVQAMVTYKYKQHSSRNDIK